MNRTARMINPRDTVQHSRALSLNAQGIPIGTMRRKRNIKQGFPFILSLRRAAGGKIRRGAVAADIELHRSILRKLHAHRKRMQMAFVCGIKRFRLPAAKIAKLRIPGKAFTLLRSQAAAFAR